MQEVKFSELEEKQTYIVEQKIKEKRPKSVLMMSEFEESFEFEKQQLITILKIELPYFVIKTNRGRDFIKLTDKFKYLKPSQEFVKAVKITARMNTKYLSRSGIIISYFHPKKS